MRLDVGVEVGEGKRVARLFGKFRQEREERVAAVVHAREVTPVKAQRATTELLCAIPQQLFAVCRRERIWQEYGRHVIRRNIEKNTKKCPLSTIKRIAGVFCRQSAVAAG